MKTDAFIHYVFYGFDCFGEFCEYLSCSKMTLSKLNRTSPDWYRMSESPNKVNSFEVNLCLNAFVQPVYKTV